MTVESQSTGIFMIDPSMVELVPIGELKVYKKNAKVHTPEQIEQIVNSIQQFGMNDPIGIWGEDNVIVEGHGRYLALRSIGETGEVPVIRLDHLTDEQRRAYALAHNNLTMNTGFDDKFLLPELDELDDFFDMSDFGFDFSLDDDKETEITEDVTPEVDDTEPVCQIGQIWQLGRHRLICGDSTDPNVIDRLMDGEMADIAITSPPYGERNSAGIRHHYKKGKARIDSLYENHDDDITHWFDLLQGSFYTMRTASKAQFINIQMLADNKRELLRFLNENRDYFVDVMVWYKKKAPPQMESNILNNAFEFVFCFYDEGASRKIPFGNFHGNVTNIIELSVGHNEYADIHKAVYPIELPAKIMRISENAKSVLDPFGGTGTTLIACEQLNRRCFMAEISEKYCDVIIQRYENLTGEKAVLIEE